MCTQKKSVLLVLVFAFCGVASFASELEIEAVGNGGELYELVAGRYGKLFPGEDEHPARNNVLALSVTWPDGASERLLVPGTGDREGEMEAELLYERAHGSLLVVWQGDLGAGVLLELTTFSGGEWSRVHAIDSSSPILGQPRLVVTRDHYDLRISETQWESIDRTALYVAWLAEDPRGVDVRITPLLFVEGFYSGWNQVFSLRDLTALPDFAGPGPSSQELLRSFDLVVMNDGQRIEVSFVNALDHQLTVVSVGVLPLELAMMSEELRDGLLGLESSFASQDVETFIDIARHEMVAVGRRLRFHPVFVDFLVTGLGEEIRTIAPAFSLATYGEMVDHLRDHTLRRTAPLTRTGLSSAGAGDESEILEIDVSNLLSPTGPPPILDLRVLFSQPAPATGAGSTRIYAAGDGGSVLVTWEEAEGRVHYLESRDGGWSETRSLATGEGLSSARAYEILERRIR